jgi:4-diphosphocytidyl-2C-methyl-D-erythritol kinase
MMTGSGSGMMGFSVDKEVLESAARQLKDKYPFVQVVQVGV